MYIKRTLFSLYKKAKRDTLIEISGRLSKETSKNRIRIIADMIWCSLKYGAMFTEYGDLDFIHRTAKNRATFITTFYNFKLYDKINDKQHRDDFHNKIRFLNKFSTIIKREWLDLTKSSDEQISSFLKKHKKVVFKSSYGDSGKEVKIILFDENTDVAAFKRIALENNFDMAEECLQNHEQLAYFNETSLNTIRIVTVKTQKKADVLFAGLRIGAKGALLDNISQGGAVARIDLDTGKIDSGFFTKRSSIPTDDIAADAIGYQLPYWQEVKDLALRASDIIPQMGIVAWDICITPNGPEIIEGNESFGSVIMQLYYNCTQEGLKPKLLKIIQEG